MLLEQRSHMRYRVTFNEAWNRTDEIWSGRTEIQTRNPQLGKRCATVTLQPLRLELTGRSRSTLREIETEIY